MRLINLSKQFRSNEVVSKRAKLRRHLKRMLLLSLSIALVVGLMFSPVFSLKNVNIVGANHVDVKAIENGLSDKMEKNLIFLNKSEILTNILKYPYVKEAQIAKRPLHTLVITLEERVPLAILVTDEVSYIIDKEANLLQVKQDSDVFDLPIISGVALKNDEKLGETVKNDEVILAAKLINENKESISEFIQEINVKNRHDILLYTTQGIEVRFGDEKHSAERLKKLFDIIEQVVLPRSLNGKIEYVDMRYLSGPVIKMKTESKTLTNDALPIAQAP